MNAENYMDGKSLDIQQSKVEKLKELFPEAVSEGKVDWEKLKATLGEDINFSNERYVLNWAGKSDSFKLIQEQTTATLTPDKDESVNFEDTNNIFIEGENLEVLKVLQKSYHNKVKMIYIDPPYNTGNDHFIYPDKFSEKKDDYLKRIGEKDEAGYITREGIFRKNNRDSGHYHSNWLNMMYPRLFLARNMLKDDGVIFVSIDDNEVHNLRLLMNEIFGEENFIDCIIWKKRYGGGAKEKYLVTLHEYVLFYAKNIESIENVFVPLDDASVKRYYKSKDENFSKRGPYRTHPLEATKSVGKRENLIFPILAPDGTEIWPKRQWWWDKNRVKNAIKKNELEFIKRKDGEWSVHTKQYLNDEDGTQRMTKPFSIIDSVYTQHGTKEIADLFGDSRYFSFPKPSKLVHELMLLANLQKGEIVLDFFAGSAATAHAVYNFNFHHQQRVKYVCVQLPEKTELESVAALNDLRNIADIAKERIRKVIKKFENEQEAEKNEKAGQLQFEDKKEGPKLELGFKVFKLRESNFKIWRGREYENGEELAKQLEVFTNPVKEGVDEENMLYELLLKSGYDLNSKVENKGTFFVVNDREMVVALNGMNEEIVKKIISLKPIKCIALDKLFTGNDQLKTNTVLQMRDAGVEFKTI